MKKINFFLAISSFLVGIILIEFFFILKYSNISKEYKLSLNDKRFMLFSEGNVFSNIDKIFKYYPNQKIISKTFYKIDNTWKKEYEYEIVTNNFGLVQKDDIKTNSPSILFLGDSFIEGQGSYSWVNKFNGKFENYQIINGGIIGTGPQQFELLEKHISNKFQVEKLIFFYIGDDLRRNIFNISDNSLSCLKDHTNCIGNENFYGFPFTQKPPFEFLNFLDKYRKEQTDNKNFYNITKFKVKKFFLELNTVKIIKNFIKQKFYISKNEYIQRNFRSIENLFKKYKNSIIFVQLTSKNEIIYGQEYDTFYAEQFIKQLTEKHFVCDFERDIKNYYKIDMHPNKKGYESLFNCVEKILQNQL